MRLFITGATGFIGSHVLVALLAAGHEVRALRRSPSSLPVISLPCQPVWIEGELHSLKGSWLEGVHAVIHLAAVGVSPKPASWSELLQVNVAGSLRLLALASDCGVRRCVFAGTYHEYGTAARSLMQYPPIPPNTPLEPLSAYGSSKLAAFQLLRVLAIELNIEFFYGRISSAYGDGQFEGNFWPSLRRAALAGEDFAMTSGRQISDFIPVAAVAGHIIEACKRPDIRAGVPLLANIGSGVATTLLAFAEAEWDRLGATGKLMPGSLPDRSDRIARYVPDILGLLIPTSPPTRNP